MDMNIVCLDLEGVLVPEIWIAFAEETGIPTSWTLLSLWSSKAYLARKSIWHLSRTISR